MVTKRKARGPSSVVQQGVRVLAKICGRHAALYMCSKAGGVIALESPGERTVAQLADLDPRVIHVKQQPFTLDVATGQFFETRAERDADRCAREVVDALHRDYTPDFRFVLSDGRRVVVEVKDPRYPGNDAYQRKLADAGAIFAAHGLQFIVMSLMYDPNAPLIFNANTLSSARYSNTDHLELASIQEVLEKAIGHQQISLGQAIGLAGLTMRDVPTLLLRGLLTTDLRKSRLTTAAEVSLAYGDMRQFELLPLGESQ